MDIDRKTRSAAWAEPLLAKGELVVWELQEPIDDSNITSRIRALTTGLTKVGPSTRPSGWVLWAEQFYRLPEIHKATPFGTVLVDSATLLNEHLKSMIMFDAKRSKFTFDQWNALKIGWMDTFSVMRDICIANDWDLIVTVHERFKEEPGDRTTGVRVEMVASGEGTAQQRTYLGTQDVKVWASIDGAFGDLIGAQADEYYWLHVEMEDKKPVWKCRVKPDGRRALRTSFMLTEVEYPCDFRRIWK